MPELFDLLENPVFWVSLSTAFVTIMLVRALTPIVSKSLDKRAAEINEELERAVALREEAQIILAQYQKKQRESLKEAEEIVQKANLEARRITREVEQDVEEQLKKRMKLAMDKIEQAERQALQEVQNRIIDITVAASRSLVNSKLTDKAREELVASATNDVQKKMH